MEGLHLSGSIVKQCRESAVHAAILGWHLRVRRRWPRWRQFLHRPEPALEEAAPPLSMSLEPPRDVKRRGVVVGAICVTLTRSQSRSSASSQRRTSAAARVGTRPTRRGVEKPPATTGDGVSSRVERIQAGNHRSGRTADAGAREEEGVGVAGRGAAAIGAVPRAARAWGGCAWSSLSTSTRSTHSQSEVRGRRCEAT